MRNRARKWLAVPVLLLACGLGLWGWGLPASTNTGEAWAAVPDRSAGFSIPMPLQGGYNTRRESIPPVQWQSGPARLVGPASAYQPLRLGLPNLPIFGENYRANTDTQNPNLAQQEPSIAVNPTNPLNVVVSAKDERGGVNTKQTWIYSSSDGGVTWLNQLFPFRLPAPGFSSDPVVNFSDDGICYVTSLPYGSGSVGIQVATSTDGGITFSTGTQVTSNPNSDKEWTWIDNFPSSPYYHRIYVAWRNFGTGPDIVLNYSADRGQTWSADSSVITTAFQFPMPVVLPNGHVLVTYRASSSDAAYTRSTDGGVTFGSQQTIAPINPPQCPPDNSGCSIWRLNPIPSTAVNPTNGDMVIIWSDGTDGGATIYYSRSTDNGATWSEVGVLAPSGVSGTYQVEPWVEADETGMFHAIWYDGRESPNTSIFHIYYSQSTDSGGTWSTAQRISTASSDLRIGIPSSYNRAAGDYIQVSASHGNVYGAWTDTRSGTGEDIYVVRGTYGGGANTPTPTSTRTNTPTNTPTNTSTPTNTPTSIPTGAPTNTATSTPAVTLRGHVLLQGRPAPPNPRWSVPVTLTLKLGSDPAVEYTGLTTDSSGYFTVTAPAPGAYSWRVKNPQTLANTGSATLVPGVNTVEMNTLAEGDADNTNCANLTDFNITRITFGKSLGDPGYDPRADFNGDNVVNTGDFGLLRGSYGFCGAGPIGPAGGY